MLLPDVRKERKRMLLEYEGRVPLNRQREYRALKRRAWENSCFVGIVSEEEAAQEEAKFLQEKRDFQYVLHMSNYQFGSVDALCVSRYNGNDFRCFSYTSRSLEELLRELHMFEWHIGVESGAIDRSNSVTFRQIAQKRARNATIAWLLCAKRVFIVRDVARYIAQLLWQDLKVWIP